MSPAERYHDLIARARDLREALPWNCWTPDELRRWQVWERARARAFDYYCEQLMGNIFTDLAPATIDPLDALGRRKPFRFVAADLGAAMAELQAWGPRVEERVQLLAKGLRKMAQTPFTTEGDQQWVAMVDYWITLRKDGKKRLDAEGNPVRDERGKYVWEILSLQDMLHEIWAVAIRARRLYLDLDPEGQAQAEALWGPLRDKGRDPVNAFTLVNAVWPGEFIARMDRAARDEGFMFIGQEGGPPWLQKGRSAAETRSAAARGKGTPPSPPSRQPGATPATGTGASSSSASTPSPSTPSATPNRRSRGRTGAGSST